MKKLKKVPVLIILFVTLLQFTSMGQDDPVDQIDSPPDPSDTPIDGGLAFLLAAGAAYGVKKYRDASLKEEEVSAMAV